MIIFSYTCLRLSDSTAEKLAAAIDLLPTYQLPVFEPTTYFELAIVLCSLLSLTNLFLASAFVKFNAKWSSLLFASSPEKFPCPIHFPDSILVGQTLFFIWDQLLLVLVHPGENLGGVLGSELFNREVSGEEQRLKGQWIGQLVWGVKYDVISQRMIRVHVVHKAETSLLFPLIAAN